MRRLPGLVNGDYLIYRALSQRGKGGVYQALDFTAVPPRFVILKEGRRHGETDLEGLDGYARLRQEGHVLRSLRTAGLPVPPLLNEFSFDGKRYLVMEMLAGRVLSPPAQDNPRQPSWRAARRILDKLAPILSRMHDAGWVWRDCKPTHVICRHGEYRLLDFENACRVKSQRPQCWGSPGYQLPGGDKAGRRQPGTKEDDYALGVIAFQYGTGRFPPLGTPRRARLYARHNCPKGLRERIETLLRN